MLVSLKWLNQYVKVDDLDPKALADRITNAGIEVESVYRLSEATNCVIGYVASLEKHPQADKLSICQVDIGEGDLKQIICGAPNVAQGQKVIVAKIGAVLPGGFKIKKAKLRGVESHGMICSLQELGIENKFVPEAYQQGIYVFNDDAPVGEDAIRYLGFDDTILDLELTPNRSDCLSILGVAYEVGAIYDRPVTLPSTENNEYYKEDESFSVTIETPNCELYYAKKVRGVKIGPSPLWMQQALISANVRPINNVVDITNYVMLELGQPLHAFDLNKMKRQEILVRQAKAGEVLTTLDEIERELTPEDVVITDGVHPIALAGVMGGLDTAIDDQTVDVLLESAVFDPLSVRQTYTRLNLRSESSIRFEKQVDPGRTLYAINRAAELMVELCGAEIDPSVSVADQTRQHEHAINLSVGKVERVLGIKISANEIADIFRRLQFSFILKGDTFRVIAPSRRPDITIEEDLIEEIIRIHGYEHLQETLPLTETTGSLTPIQKGRRLIVDSLIACGLTEVVTYSLLGDSELNRFQHCETDTFEPITLKMPMSEDRKHLRHSLIHHHLSVLQYNEARKVENPQIFEIGKRYEWTDQGPKEEEVLAGALTGYALEPNWQKKSEKIDFYYVKGIVEAVFEKLRLLDQVTFVQADDQLGPDFHGGRTAYILFDGIRVGVIGQVHPEVLKEYDLDETYVFEIVLEGVFKLAQPKPLHYETISRYPGMTRDLALIVDETVIAGHLKQAIERVAGPLLKSVSIFDVYIGEHVPEGKKSVAFSLHFERTDRTLTEEEVTKVTQKILNILEEDFGAVLRG